MYEIPLTSKPDQNFQVTIPVDGNNITLRFRVRYNTQGNYWWMSISDKEGKVLIDALPLLGGGNLLEPHSYLGIGSAYVINTGNNYMDYPDSTNLGTDFKLIWGDTGGN